MKRRISKTISSKTIYGK